MALTEHLELKRELF